MVGYCLGLGVPFLAMSPAAERSVPLLCALGRRRQAIDVVSGAVLVPMGVLLMTDNLLILTNFLGRVLPAQLGDPFGL